MKTMANNATLTRAMLDDLNKGYAAISLLPYPSGGVSFEALDFSGADQLFTLKDSFQLTPSEATTEEVKIDQKDETIDTIVERGDYNMTGQIPSVAEELLSYFFPKAKSITSVTGQEGDVYEGASFFSEPKEVLVSVLVESESKGTSIAFAKVKLIVSGGITKENSTQPAYLSFTGNVLANGKAGEGDFSVLKKKASTGA